MVSRGIKGRYALYLIDVDKKTSSALTKAGADFEPAWSPSGDQVAFSRLVQRQLRRLHDAGEQRSAGAEADQPSGRGRGPGVVAGRNDDPLRSARTGIYSLADRRQDGQAPWACRVRPAKGVDVVKPDWAPAVGGGATGPRGGGRKQDVRVLVLPGLHRHHRPRRDRGDDRLQHMCAKAGADKVRGTGVTTRSTVDRATPACPRASGPTGCWPRRLGHRVCEGTVCSGRRLRLRQRRRQHHGQRLGRQGGSTPAAAPAPARPLEGGRDDGGRPNGRRGGQRAPRAARASRASRSRRAEADPHRQEDRGVRDGRVWAHRGGLGDCPDLLRG